MFHTSSWNACNRLYWPNVSVDNQISTRSPRSRLRLKSVTIISLVDVNNKFQGQKTTIILYRNGLLLSPPQHQHSQEGNKCYPIDFISKSILFLSKVLHQSNLPQLQPTLRKITMLSSPLGLHRLLSLL